MTQKHTPTPWEYDCESDFIIGDNGDYICSMDIGYSCSEMEEKEANAAHIVKCVNMHDELVEALRDLLSSHSPYAWGSVTDKVDALMNAEKTLKKAGAL